MVVDGTVPLLFRNLYPRQHKARSSCAMPAVTRIHQRKKALRSKTSRERRSKERGSIFHQHTGVEAVLSTVLFSKEGGLPQTRPEVSSQCIIICANRICCRSELSNLHNRSPPPPALMATRTAADAKSRQCTEYPHVLEVVDGTSQLCACPPTDEQNWGK